MTDANFGTIKQKDSLLSRYEIFCGASCSYSTLVASWARGAWAGSRASAPASSSKSPVARPTTVGLQAYFATDKEQNKMTQTERQDEMC